jgi:hypothetical protein
MPSYTDKYKAMIDSLYENTMARKIDWKLTDRGNPFVQVGNYSVILENKEDADGSPYILVSINDMFGGFIESFSDNTLSEETPGISNFSNYWGLMEDLINIARRQARGADSALDDIIKQLGPDDS